MVGRIIWLLLAPALIVAGLPIVAGAQSITNDRDLSFGFCDATPSATYTVLPAALPGGGACQGAASAQFTVTGTLNSRAKVSIPNTVVITNGSENLSVSISDSIGNPFNICFGTTGTVTIWLGGSATIPAGGLTTSGPFTNTDLISVVYIGGSC
jgi:hypothetical protein